MKNITMIILASAQKIWKMLGEMQVATIYTLLQKISNGLLLKVLQPRELHEPPLNIIADTAIKALLGIIGFAYMRPIDTW